MKQAFQFCDSIMTNSYSDLLLVPFAKYLKKYGKLELSNLGTSLLVPKEGFHFNSIMFKPKHIPYSADKSWEFIGSVIILENEDFSKENIPLYQRLKGLDCTLSIEGFLRKSYIMKSNDLLNYLKQEIPELLIDSHLCEIINQDSTLRDLLKEITPDSLSITLFNQPLSTSDLTEYCKQFKQIFESPSEIIWNINLEKYIGGIISKKKYTYIIDSIIQALDIISEHLLREVKIIQARL
jgi:hypothetical protein